MIVPKIGEAITKSELRVGIEGLKCEIWFVRRHWPLCCCHRRRQAADDFIKGVYLQSEELCAQAKKDSLQTVIEAGNIILTAHGLESIEYNCEFLQVTKADARAGLAGERDLPGARLFVPRRALDRRDELRPSSTSCR